MKGKRVVQKEGTKQAWGIFLFGGGSFPAEADDLRDFPLRNSRLRGTSATSQPFATSATLLPSPFHATNRPRPAVVWNECDPGNLPRRYRH